MKVTLNSPQWWSIDDLLSQQTLFEKNITFPAPEDEHHVFWSGDLLPCYFVISLTFILNILLMEEILHQLRYINIFVYYIRYLII